MSTIDNNANSNNSLQPVASSGSLVTQEIQRANRQLALAGKVGTQLILNDDRRRWIALLIHHIQSKETGAFDVTKFLSRNASLSLMLLERYEKYWDWDALSNNPSLSWSFDLLARFENQWNWNSISHNNYMPWSLELLEHFEGRWDWHSLSNSESIPWSLELLERFEECWDWGFFHPIEDRREAGLSDNGSLPWSPRLLERFEDRWNWEGLSNNTSLPWSLELLERFEDRWEWGGKYMGITMNHDPIISVGISNNTALFFSLELIEHFETRWAWNHGFSCNKSLPLSVELLERFEERWHWDQLSRNESPRWSQELLERFEDRLSWNWIANNESIPWSLELLERFEWNFDERWGCWSSLSENESLPWSKELISLYADKWDFSRLAKNKYICESELSELVDYYISEKENDSGSCEDNFWENSLQSLQHDIYHITLGNYYWNEESERPPEGLGTEMLPWSVELLEKYEECLNWKRLSSDNVLPWSLGLLEHFKDRWDLGETTHFFALPLTENDIDEIMQSRMLSREEMAQSLEQDVEQKRKTEGWAGTIHRAIKKWW